MKTRDSGADRQLWRYEISDNGISLVEPYAKTSQQLMSGGPTSSGRKPVPPKKRSLPKKPAKKPKSPRKARP